MLTMLQWSRVTIMALCAACAWPAIAQQETGATSATRKLETVATFDGPMPTGVTVSRSGRIFVNFPRWGDDVKFTVAELKDGKAVAFPNQDVNTTPPASSQLSGFVSVQSVVVDPKDRLWALDTGAIKLGPTSPGGPKLVMIDLANDKITTRIAVPPDVALKTTYLNDIRFDLRARDGFPEGVAYITDSASSGPAGLITVNLATGKSWRNLSGDPSVQAEPGFVPVVEGKKLMKQETPEDKPTPPKMGADGIAISADGSRLYYCPLISRKLFSVDTAALRKESGAQPAPREEPARQGAADGLESDAEGNLYFTDYEHHSVVKRSGGHDTTLVVLPPHVWPDTLSVADDGYLYIMANQLHRQAAYNAGVDRRQKPYALYRVKIDAQPVRLVEQK